MRFVATEDGDKLLCKTCHSAQGGKLLFWLPEDAENYPAVCEGCGGVMKSPGNWEEPRDVQSESSNDI